MKIYFPWEDPIQVHQIRVKPCPPGFMATFTGMGPSNKDLADHNEGLADLGVPLMESRGVAFTEPVVEGPAVAIPPLAEGDVTHHTSHLHAT